MRGSYEITVRNKNAEYNFVVRRKYTLLTGDSGTGKSMLYRMLTDKFTYINITTMDGEKNVKLSTVPFREDEYRDLLPCSSPRIYIVDESVDKVNSIKFKRLMEQSNAYFVLIGRKLLQYSGVENDRKVMETLPLSISEIYRIDSDVGKINGKEYYRNKFSNTYKVFGGADCRVDALIVEDSGSGSKIYGNCFKEAELYTAGGNGSIVKSLLKIDANNYSNYIAIFVDGAAYGTYIKQLLSVIKKCKNKIAVYAPESLEWLLLRSIPTKLYTYPFNKDVLLNPQRYCDKDAFTKLVYPYNQFDITKFESWEQLFTNYLTYLMSNTIVKAPYTKSLRVSNFYLSFCNTILSIINNEL